jgi:hypothetical protein
MKRDDWGAALTVLDRCGKTWPSALSEGLGEQRGRGAGQPAQALVEHELGGAADKAVDLEGWKSVRRETGKE